MKHNPDIAAELAFLKVAHSFPTGKTSEFELPQGYFQQLPAAVLENIRLMSADEPVLSAQKPISAEYAIPDSYFANFSTQILAKIKGFELAANKLNFEWSAAAKNDTYKIPTGYFEHFHEELWNRINVEQLASDEVEELSPLLASLKNTESYKVEAGYFEALKQSAPEVAARVPQKAEHPGVRSIKWARWAAAASVFVIFALGAVNFFNPVHSGSATSIERSLAKIPDERIKEWLASNMDEEDINSMAGSVANSKISANASLEQFSEQQVEDYLATEM